MKIMQGKNRNHEEDLYDILPLRIAGLLLSWSNYFENEARIRCVKRFIV